MAILLDKFVAASSEAAQMDLIAEMQARKKAEVSKAGVNRPSSVHAVSPQAAQSPIM